MDLKETGWERLHWIYLVEGRDKQGNDLNTVMYLLIKKDVNYPKKCLHGFRRET